MLRFVTICCAVLFVSSAWMGCSSKPCKGNQDCDETQSCTSEGVCRRAPKSVPSKEKKVVQDEESTEAEKEAAYRKRLEAKLNQPEPKLDPKSPRETFLWLIKAGQKEMDAIDVERQAIIAKIKDYKVVLPEHKRVVSGALYKLKEFSIGMTVSELETAPGRLCAVIEAIRKPVEKMTNEARPKLREINTAWEVLEKIEQEWLKKETEQGKLSRSDQKKRVKNNRKMLKLQEEKDKYLPALNAGNAILLGMRSFLREAMVLAQYGARRTQKALGACLKTVNTKYISLDLVQTLMNKVITRTRYYRE
jgi:hypothetical protein